MLGIRTDANRIIATGHVMRCMTIADEAIKLGKDVIFFVADEDSASFVRERGFMCEILGSSWENPASETDLLSQLIKKHDVDTVLFDSYSFDAEYFEKLRAASDSKFVYMDDLCTQKMPVDTVINYNIYANDLGYDKKYGESINLLLGPVYAPLRPQFGEVYEKKCTIPTNVLVCAGGGDVTDILFDILSGIENEPALKKADFHVVVGSMSDDEKDLMRLAFCSDNIFIHRNVTEMAKLMSECDMAVSAGGTMLTELCCMKVPTIEFAIADNQLKNAAYYGEHGIMIAAGDIRQKRQAVVNRIVYNLAELISDKKKLAEMRKKMEGICDGFGAKRIAEALC
jgi:UDP-2,4-diacetamido-2,4,6-trideoxy-beta-L-altropyranose hydrolase